MAIGPKGPPQKPGLSIRGRVIFDTVRGVPRVRPWPASKTPKPGSRREWTAKAFGAANRACKVTASTFYGDNWEATRGTPLLPRDLMIAFMYGRAVAFTLEDGTEIWSMQARADVSKSLDVLGSTAGSVLVRSDKYWVARPEGAAAPVWYVWGTRVTNVFGANHATRGVSFTTLADFHVKALQAMFQSAIGRRYQLHIARLNPSHQITAIVSTEQYTSTFNGNGSWNFPILDTIQTGERVAFLFTRTDAGPTGVPFNWEDTNVMLPAPIHSVGRVNAQNDNPKVGDTLAHQAGHAFVPMINPLALVI